MGGGYASRLATIIDAHANTYRVARQIFGYASKQIVLILQHV